MHAFYLQRCPEPRPHAPFIENSNPFSARTRKKRRLLNENEKTYKPTQLASTAAVPLRSSSSAVTNSGSVAVGGKHAPSLLARESKLSLPALCDSATETCWKAQLKVKGRKSREGAGKRKRA